MTDVTWNPAGDDDTSFGPLTSHNVLGGRTAADAHPAAAVSYDPAVSGLTADTVQEAIDELAESGGGGAVDSVNGETGVVVLDAADVGAVPVTAVGLLAGERNRGGWDNATTYAVGDVVHDHADGSIFVANAPNVGEQPSLGLGSWDVIDGTGRQMALGPGASASPTLAASFGPAASAAGDISTAVGPSASAAGDLSTAVGPFASAAGDISTAVGLFASTTTDGEVNIANIYRGSIDPGDPTTPLTATIATGFVDLPETADATNPAADHQRIVARTDGIYVRDETGTESGPLGGAVAPLAHAASHQDGGSDELALDGSQITTGKVGSARLGTHPGLIDGAWHYLSRRSADLPGSTAYQPGANMLVACLLEIVEDCEISGRWYRTEGGSAGAKARVGLYAVSATTGLPTGSPLLSTPETETAASYRSDTFTAVPMSAGFVWLVAATGHATSGWRGFGAPNETVSLAVDMGGPVGSPVATRGFTGSATYTGTLPDVTAVSWTASTTMPAPYCRWRIERI